MREAGESVSEFCNVTKTQLVMVGFEDGGRCPEPRNTDTLHLEALKGKETHSPLEPPKRNMALLTF